MHCGLGYVGLPSLQHRVPFFSEFSSLERSMDNFPLYHCKALLYKPPSPRVQEPV